MNRPAALNISSAHVQEHEKNGETYYSLVGRYPKYFHKLRFSDRKTAEEAKKEANEVLKSAEAPEDSKFMDAYFETNGNRETGWLYGNQETVWL